jgi:hypothetical protein
MTKESLEALESEVNAELLKMAKAEATSYYPITDGVVDIEQYLQSSPTILWILKESWEDNGVGDWSVTKDLMLKGVVEGTTGNKGIYAKMAYITYSVFNGYPEWNDIPHVTKDPQVPGSLRRIAYINLNKGPGGKRSNAANIESYYRRNRHLLKRQVETMNPDIVIAGNVLHLFYDDLGLKHEDFTSEGSVDVCSKNGRMYINAYHPAYWCIKAQRYVEDIVAAIKKHRERREVK